MQNQIEAARTIANIMTAVVVVISFFIGLNLVVKLRTELTAKQSSPILFLPEQFAFQQIVDTLEGQCQRTLAASLI